MFVGHPERHSTSRFGWLRATVLGANDGLVSTASLMVGVATSGASTGVILTAGIAGVAAGAMAMAAGEYVSVSSQADIEHVDRAIETAELATNPEGELTELVGILCPIVALRSNGRSVVGTHRTVLMAQEVGGRETADPPPTIATRGLDVMSGLSARHASSRFRDKGCGWGEKHVVSLVGGELLQVRGPRGELEVSADRAAPTRSWPSRWAGRGGLPAPRRPTPRGLT
jgi:hypothetical protein